MRVKRSIKKKKIGGGEKGETGRRKKKRKGEEGENEKRGQK